MGGKEFIPPPLTIAGSCEDDDISDLVGDEHPHERHVQDNALHQHPHKGHGEERVQKNSHHLTAHLHGGGGGGGERGRKKKIREPQIKTPQN